MQREIKIKEGYKIQINKVYALADLQSSWREEYEIWMPVTLIFISWRSKSANRRGPAYCFVLSF